MTALQNLLNAHREKGTYFEDLICPPTLAVTHAQRRYLI
jgi:hypothetical protein